MDQNNNRKNGGNMSLTFGIRVIAALFVFYSLFDIVKAYFAGGEDAPSLMLLALSALVLGGGGIFIAFMAWKEWKKPQSGPEEPAENQLPEAAEGTEETEEK